MGKQLDEYKAAGAAILSALRDARSNGTIVPLRTVPADAPKCEHNRGRWLVRYGEATYAIDPNTQFQKDVLRGSMEQRGASSEAVDAVLRWHCFECDTVQVP